MPYDSTITFTLDTICPWTYLALRRLLTALSDFRSSDLSQKASFTLLFSPYQLYPDFSTTGERKHEWYMNKRYQGSEELVGKYETVMSAYGHAEGINFKWGGHIANTFRAHRLVWWVQDQKKLGPEQTVELVKGLYRRYFEEERHPSSDETLVGVAKDVGVGEEEVRRFLESEEGEEEVKERIQESAGNGVDSVPYIMFEGRRRDFTVVGAKEVGEYKKTLESVAKESG